MQTSVFSKKILDKAVLEAQRMLELGLKSGEIAVGKKGKLLLSQEKSALQPIHSFTVQGQIFYVGLESH